MYTLPKNKVSNLAEHRYKRRFVSDKDLEFITAKDLAVLLNSFKKNDAISFINQRLAPVSVQEMFDFPLVYIDPDSNVIYFDSSIGKYCSERLVNLIQYQSSRLYLSNFVSDISDLPVIIEGSYLFYKCTVHNLKCLVCQIGQKDEYYAILKPTISGHYPSRNDSSFDWEIYRSDITGFFFTDKDQYDFDECIARMRMAEMLASHRL
jgi:hypothetical protein